MGWLIGIAVLIAIIAVCMRHSDTIVGFIVLGVAGWLTYEFGGGILSFLMDYWLWGVGIFGALIALGVYGQQIQKKEAEDNISSLSGEIATILKLDEKSTQEMQTYMQREDANFKLIFTLIYILVYKVVHIDGGLSREEEYTLDKLGKFISENIKYKDFELTSCESNFSTDEIVELIKKINDNIPYSFFDSIIDAAANIDLEYSPDEKKFLDEFRYKTDRIKVIPVVATMSSGKSTLVNALLKEDLLPTQNEACTATVFKIEQFSSLQKSVMRNTTGVMGVSKWENASLNTLIEWNKENPIEIEVRANYLESPQDKITTILYDTPGGNNSNDARHAEITNRILRSSNFAEVVVVLNAEQSGINDEKYFLENLLKVQQEKASRLDIIFILNKVDAFDLEKDENIVSFVEKKRKDLIQLGFIKPTIIPTMAKLATNIRSLIHSPEEFSKRPTRKQNDLLNDIHMILDFEKSYRKALENSAKNKNLLEAAIDKKMQKLGKRTFKIGNERLNGEKIAMAEVLTGVSLLEEYFYHNDLIR